MKRRQLFWLATAAVAAFLFSHGCTDTWSPSTSTATYPAVELSMTAFDFGFVEPYTILPYTFYARSTGTAPLTFYRYSGSSFTRIGENPGDDYIMPGDSLRLEGWYRNPGYNYSGMMLIYLYFNNSQVVTELGFSGKLRSYFVHPLETDSLKREFPFVGSADELTTSVPFYNTTTDTAWITPVLLPDSRVEVSLPQFIPPGEERSVEVSVAGLPVGVGYYQAITFDVQTSDSSRYTIGVYRAGS